MSREVRTGYVEVEGGVKLYYSLHGAAGGRTIACCNGLGVTTCFWKYTTAHFTRKAAVLMWDYRGHGRSEMPLGADDLSIGQCARDLEIVFDRLGVGKAVLLGHSMGVQVILEFCRRFPERVEGLVPMLGTYARPVDTFFNTKLSHVPFAIGLWLAENHPHLMVEFDRFLINTSFAYNVARLTGIIHPKLCKREDMDPYLEHLSKLDPQVFFRMARGAQQHSAEAYLGELDVPVLVIAGERDLFTPMWCSEKMASDLPRASLFVIPEGSHAALVERPELVIGRMEKFLSEKVWPSRPKGSGRGGRTVGKRGRRQKAG